MLKTFGIVLLCIAILAIALVVFWLWNVRAVVAPLQSTLPEDFPNEGFPHTIFEQLVQQYRDEQGQINYANWQQSPESKQQLAQYLAAVAVYSPENAPERFPTKQHTLAYWVQAYNATVIHTILNNWPLKSVQDLKAPVEIIKGLGFFYKMKHVFGGKAYSLYTVENSKVFQGDIDPRIHFVLNCGSGSCPVIRPSLPLGNELEPFLKEAAMAFVSHPENLLIDHAKQQVTLSMIFKWYQEQFTQTAPKHLNKSAQLLSYIASIAAPIQAAELQKSLNYVIHFAEYDWSLNDSRDSSNEPELEPTELKP